MPFRTGELWRHADFLKLWAGQTVSLLGDQITRLAVQLAAVQTLMATPAQMGVLLAAQYAPYLLLSLPASVWVDRVRRRPLLIASDIGRAVLLATISAAAALGWLAMTHLYVVAFAAAVLGLVSGVAQRAYLPTLIPRQLLVEGNGKLEVSRSVAQVAGPGAAGVLVQLVGAPFAVAADALSFLVSALSLRALRAPESDPAPSAGRRAWADVVDGLRFLGRHPVLRAIAGANGTYNFFSGIWGAVFVLYLTRDLRIPPAPLGFILGTAGLAALLGALLAPAVTERAGLGRTIVASFALASAANLLVPLADGPLALVVGLVAASRFVYDFLVPVYNVSQSSLRQAVTPDHLLGRTSAAQSFISWGAIPIGALAGGALAELLGARTCLLIAAAGGMLGTAWLLLSPVAPLRALPATPTDPT